MDIKQKRAPISVLYQAKTTRSNIFKDLEHLGITRLFVYRTIKRFSETNGIADRPRSGRPQSLRTPALVKAVREQIRRNPCRKKCFLAKQMNAAKRTLCRVINEDLRLRGYRRTTGHFLTQDLMGKLQLRAKALLRRYGRNRQKNSFLRTRKFFMLKNPLTTKTAECTLAVLKKRNRRRNACRGPIIRHA
jgi:hypothetical protein